MLGTYQAVNIKDELIGPLKVCRRDAVSINLLREQHGKISEDRLGVSRNGLEETK